MLTGDNNPEGSTCIELETAIVWMSDLVFDIGKEYENWDGGNGGLVEVLAVPPSCSRSMLRLLDDSASSSDG